MNERCEVNSENREVIVLIIMCTRLALRRKQDVWHSHGIGLVRASLCDGTDGFAVTVRLGKRMECCFALQECGFASLANSCDEQQSYLRVISSM